MPRPAKKSMDYEQLVTAIDAASQQQPVERGFCDAFNVGISKFVARALTKT